MNQEFKTLFKSLLSFKENMESIEILLKSINQTEDPEERKEKFIDFVSDLYTLESYIDHIAFEEFKHFKTKFHKAAAISNLITPEKAQEIKSHIDAFSKKSYDA